jgi:MFS family permease
VNEQPADVSRLRWGRLVIDTTPLRVPAYRRLWVSTIVTAIGTQLTAVAVPYQIYGITRSSGYVGLAGAVALLPLIVFGLWGGAVADAVDRRRLLLVTNSGISITSLLLWAQAAAGLRSVGAILALLALQQAFFAMNAPARSASIPRLVPRPLLPAANALASTVTQAGQIFGPLLAGATIPVIGLPQLYLVDALALTLMLWAVWRLPPLPPLNGAARLAGPGTVIDGFRYLAPRKLLLASFLADIVAMVLGMPRALFPEMAVRTFGAGVGSGLALGLLYAAMPAGAFLCGLLSGSYSRIRHHGAAVLIAIAGWGLAITAFGLCRSLWLAVPFLALAGAADMVSMVFRSSILQAEARDEMRGRIQGVQTVVVAGGPRLADLLHGTVGAAAGTTVAVSGGGALVVLGVLVLAALLPGFVRYRSAAAGATP